MNKSIIVPVIFLVIYIAVAGLFIFTLFKAGFQWIPALGAVLSLAMAYLKIRQITAARKKDQSA